jgi:sugar/nucleoside kinase (ribokinase family)
MILVPGEVTSYTVVIDPPAVDRAFLHYAGTNETFGVEDVRYDLLGQARLFHFGYPPLMSQLLAGEGAGLTEMFHRAKEQGVTTSLDLTMPDKTGAASRVDWRSLLGKTLRYVDLFVPSVPELLYMLQRERFDALMARTDSIPVHEALTTEEIDALAKEALAMGPSIVLLKAGTRGMLLRTDPLRADMGRGAPADQDSWSNRQMWAPCFRPDTVASSVGTGDAAIAGFLAAMLRGVDPALALNVASAAGACCVEVSGALGGVQSWESTLARIRAGWARLLLNLDQPGWVWDEELAVWLGPHDQTAAPTQFALG